MATKNMPVDYFSPQGVRYDYTFPDKVTTVTFKKLTEGDRAFIQDQRSVMEMDRSSNVIRMDAGSGTLKIEVLQRAMIEWDVKQKGEDGEFTRVPFEPKNVTKLLQNLDPEIIDEMYAVVQKRNPWLTAKPTREDIDKQIKILEEQKGDLDKEEKK